jgi:pre-rRNA-processing protein TSR2
LQHTFELGIWYTLALWPALHVAVQDNWGGPDSSDKRDWFAGAVSDLIIQRPDTDHDDLILFLLQVMQDEFDCNVEDDSEEEVARNILALRKRVFEDLDLSALSELETRWKNRGQIKTNIQIIDGEVEGEEDEEWDGFEEDEDGDVNMAAAEEIVPDLVPVLKKERPEPEVDEDGFTKVVGKKKR